MRNRLRFNLTAGLAVAFTARLAVPQFEAGAFASSPILPPVGTPAATTRAADSLTWARPGGFGARGTLVLRAMLPQAAPAGLDQGLCQIDDGTDQNRILIRNTAGGATIAAVLDQGGVTLATLNAGSMAAGTPFRAALAWAPGDQAFVITGGSVQTAAVAVPSGLTSLLAGHAARALNRALNGEVEVLEHYPDRLPNARLSALVA